MGKSAVLARLVAVCTVMAVAVGVSLGPAAADEGPSSATASSTSSADIAGPSPVATVTPTPGTNNPVPSAVPSPKPVTPRGEIVGPVRGVPVSNVKVAKNARLVTAKVAWNQALIARKGNRDRFSVRLVVFNGTTPVVLMSRSTTVMPAKIQKLRIRLSKSKAARLRAASDSVLTVSQQYAKPKAKTFNRNYVTVTHLKAARLKAAARSSALNARTGVSCWQRNIGPGAGLNGCDLAGAYLYNAGLQQADMTDTDLRCSVLGATNMSGTELAGSDVTCASSGGITGTPASLPTDWKLANGFIVPDTTPPAQAPNAPLAPTSSGTGNTTVTLDWVAPGINGSAITGYNVQSSTTSGGTYANATGCTSLGVVVTCTATGLTNGTTYFFKVQAASGAGNSAYSVASASFIPVAGAPNTPGAPTSSAVGNTTVTLDWVAPSINGSPITGYNVQSSTTSGGTYANATGCTSLGVVVTCTATGLTNGTTYFFKVQAASGAGNSAYSVASASFTPAAPACGTVGGTGPGGGKIFYVDMSRAAGSQCFEAAVDGWNGGADPTLLWGVGFTAGQCGNLSIATGLAIGAGETNTNLITTTAACNSSATAPAAWAARSYNGGSQSDWFLPSKDELNQLCKWARDQSTTVADQTTVCNNTGALQTGFTADYYWSSSQAVADVAWLQGFVAGDQAGGYKDLLFLPVRPVRAF